MKDYMSVKEASGKLGVSGQLVRRWLKQGRVRGVKLFGGHQWLIARQDCRKPKTSPSGGKFKPIKKK